MRSPGPDYPPAMTPGPRRLGALLLGLLLVALVVVAFYKHWIAFSKF